MGKLINKFEGIRFSSQLEGESVIKIRRSFNPLRMGGPIAIVECGECKKTYKKNLFYITNYFHIDEKLTCKCGHEDTISYERKY